MRRNSRTIGPMTRSPPSTTHTIRQTPLATSASTIGVIDITSLTTTTRGSGTWPAVPAGPAASLTSAPVGRRRTAIDRPNRRDRRDHRGEPRRNRVHHRRALPVPVHRMVDAEHGGGVYPSTSLGPSEGPGDAVLDVLHTVVALGEHGQDARLATRECVQPPRRRGTD